MISKEITDKIVEDLVMRTDVEQLNLCEELNKVICTEVNMEAVNKCVNYPIMFDLVYEEGFSIGMQKLNTLSMIQQSNDELRTLIANIDVSQAPHKVSLLNKVFSNYLEFQSSFSESEWTLLQKQAVEYVRYDYEKEQDAKYEAYKHTGSEFVFTTTSKSSIFDWDNHMAEVTSEFRKLGITIYDVSVKNKAGAVYYYLFNPNVDKPSECRDFVLHDILLDVYIRELGQCLTEDLYTKIWSKKNNDIKAIFWGTKGKKLREQLWNEMFSVCVCDRDLEEN